MQPLCTFYGTPTTLLMPPSPGIPLPPPSPTPQEPTHNRHCIPSYLFPATLYQVDDSWEVETSDSHSSYTTSSDDSLTPNPQRAHPPHYELSSEDASTISPYSSFESTSPSVSSFLSSASLSTRSYSPPVRTRSAPPILQS